VNWEKLPLGTLQEVLKYHVVPVTAYSTDLHDGEAAPTLEGGKVIVHIDARGVMINNARVIMPNVLTYNGAVHVIDKVLLPPHLLWISRL